MSLASQDAFLTLGLALIAGLFYKLYFKECREQVSAQVCASKWVIAEA